MVKNSREVIDNDKKKILEELIRDGRQSPNKIAEKYGFSRQKAWKYIKELEQEGETFANISASTVSQELAKTTKKDVYRAIDEIESQEAINKREVNSWLDDLIKDSVKG